MCVFKVKYDGREIPCDYTKPVLSRMSNVNKNITVEAKLIRPPTYNRSRTSCSKLFAVNRLFPLQNVLTLSI